MRYETIKTRVPGQVSGPVALTSYILNEVSVAPGKERSTVIVYPGGAYMRCLDREGEPVIMQFLGMGCHAFLLDYSVAPNRFPTALQELAEVVALLQERSDDWLVGMERIAAYGLSVVGYPTRSLGVFWNQEFVYGLIGRTAKKICLSAMLLRYPVVISGEFAHQGSITNLFGEKTMEMEHRKVLPELQVTADAPKTFLWHTCEDETVPVENSPLLMSALRKNGVNLGLHIFPKGGHDVSLASRKISGVGDHVHVDVSCYQSWIRLAEAWLRGI